MVIVSVLQVPLLMSLPYGIAGQEKYRGKTNLFSSKDLSAWDIAQFRPVPRVSFRQQVLSLLCNLLSCCEQKYHTWRKTGFSASV